SDARSIQQKCGVARYQEHRHQMFRSGMDGMLIDLGKWGLGVRDDVSNVNFFSKVTATATGKLVCHIGNSKAGDYVDLSFEMDRLMVLSAAPHPLDPADTYRPGAISLTASTTPPGVAEACARIAENIRGLHNTRRLYACVRGAA